MTTKKLVRNTSTPELREFWASVDQAAEEVAKWPHYLRVGLHVEQIRPEPRPIPRLDEEELELDKDL